MITISQICTNVEIYVGEIYTSVLESFYCVLDACSEISSPLNGATQYGVVWYIEVGAVQYIHLNIADIIKCNMNWLGSGG